MKASQRTTGKCKEELERTAFVMETDEFCCSSHIFKLTHRHDETNGIVRDEHAAASAAAQ